MLEYVLTRQAEAAPVLVVNEQMYNVKNTLFIDNFNTNSLLGYCLSG